MLKKVLTPLCLFVLLNAVLPVEAKVLIPAPPELAASAWILVDAETGNVLVENNADEQLPPASLTKIMTSYIVSGDIESGKMGASGQKSFMAKTVVLAGLLFRFKCREPREVRGPAR